MTSWKGIIPAIPTPFDRDGDPDLVGYTRNIEGLVAAGVHGLVAVATAGEGPSLSLSERETVLACAVKAAGNRVPVIAGVGGPNERQTVDMIRGAERVGADGLMVITPYFYQFTRSELVTYFHRIADCTDLPLMIYNSTYAGTPLDADTLEELADIENFVALKEGNQLQASEVIRRVGDRIAVFSARDTYIEEVLAAGGAGALSFTANIVPKLVLELYNASTRSDWHEALAVQRRLNPLVLLLVTHSYPAPLKAAMNVAGLCGGLVRPPLADLGEAETDALRRALLSLGIGEGNVPR